MIIAEPFTYVCVCLCVFVCVCRLTDQQGGLIHIVVEQPYNLTPNTEHKVDKQRREKRSYIERIHAYTERGRGWRRVSDQVNQKLRRESKAQVCVSFCLCVVYVVICCDECIMLTLTISPHGFCTSSPLEFLDEPEQQMEQMTAQIIKHLSQPVSKKPQVFWMWLRLANAAKGWQQHTSHHKQAGLQGSYK